jgi:hypothetical protein
MGHGLVREYLLPLAQANAVDHRRAGKVEAKFLWHFDEFDRESLLKSTDSSMNDIMIDTNLENTIDLFRQKVIIVCEGCQCRRVDAMLRINTLQYALPTTLRPRGSCTSIRSWR